jgi:hypothetical protein
MYFGLYTMVEIVFDTMLKDQFQDGTGNCYKPENEGATFAFGSFNTSDIAKKTNEDESDWSDVEELYDVLHDQSRISQPETWKSELEAIFDVDEMTHNYYLYHDPSDGLIKWIPWDCNEALMDGNMGGALSISLIEVDEQWPLIKYILDQPEYESIYKTYLREFVTTVFEPAKMQETYQSQYNLIKPYVVGTDGETEQSTFLKSDADFDNALIDLKNHVSTRKSVVEQYVN